MNNKEEFEELLKSKFIGNTIEEISLFNINEQEYEIKDCDRQIVDGGIELRLANKNTFCFGWDSKFDLHNIAFDKFENIFTGSDYQKLETKRDYFWKNIISHRIENINIQWSSFDEDNNQSIFIPDYIDFQLSFNQRFLISPMKFEVKGNELVNFKIDLEGWILTFFDKTEIEKMIKQNLGF